MTKKLGFWAVFAIVIGSQVGSGIFMLPSVLAPFGPLSIYGWLISGAGAICLALVFSGLCRRFPKTGGPHVYVNKLFGEISSFFTGWTYWVISWVSTAAVIIASISYLQPFLVNKPPFVYLFLEIILLGIITLLNLKGIHAAGVAEFILTILKIFALFLLPALAIGFFDSKHFVIEKSIHQHPLSSNLAHVTLLTLWGFIGLESATAPAEEIDNPSQTIPRAIVLGTLCTAILYLVTSVSIMGAIPGDVLSTFKAPYVEACQYLFGGQWHLIISIIAFIVCVGTLNAWILTSGQIVLGLAEDELMPKLFARKNKNLAPSFGILCSALGIVPLLILTMSENIAHQVSSIIDFSVIAFLFVYLVCVLAYLKLLIIEKAKFYHWIYSIFALIFCLWTIWQTSWSEVFYASLFIASGIPVYFLWFKKYNKELLGLLNS